MADYRSKLFRRGDRWCSKHEFDRLRREAAENGPESEDRYRRAARRCGLKLGAKQKIELGRSATRSAKEFGEQNKKKELALIQEAIRTYAVGDNTWKITCSVDLIVKPPATSWKAQIFGAMDERGTEEQQQRASDVKAVARALRKTFPHAEVHTWSNTAPLWPKGGYSSIYIVPKRLKEPRKGYL